MSRLRSALRRPIREQPRSILAALAVAVALALAAILMLLSAAANATARRAPRAGVPPGPSSTALVVAARGGHRRKP